MSIKPGILYVVATPIGNLEDLSPRAQRILSEVAVVAAEDTRHTQKLMARFEIHTPMMSCHEHNEAEAAPGLLKMLHAGQDVALVADAGTPLLSDPGARLVDRAHDGGIRVVPVPGPSALTSALSACGLPVDAFVFTGFLPETGAARKKRLQEFAAESRTMVFFETPHRIVECLRDSIEVFGAERRAAVAREMTKKFESIRRATLGEFLQRFSTGAEPARGEMVVVIAGAPARPGDAEVKEAERIMRVLLGYLSVKDAVGAASALCTLGRNDLYNLALRLRGGETGVDVPG